MAANTQCERILGHMVKYGSITPLEAQERYGIMRLASRICDLRKMGRKINARRVNVTNRYGERVTVCAYSLEEKEEQ